MKRGDKFVVTAVPERAQMFVRVGDTVTAHEDQPDDAELITIDVWRLTFWWRPQDLQRVS